MRVSVLVLSLLTSSSLYALPVVGEKVVYKGQAIKVDGVYDIERSMEIVGYDPATKQYDMKVTYNQFAEGSPMGGYDQTVKVPENGFASVENSLIPMTKTRCGTVFFAEDIRRRTVTNREYVKTGIGLLNTCKIEGPVSNNSKTIQWWAEEAQPWPLRTYEMSLNEGYTIIATLDTYVKPSIAPPQVKEEKKPNLPIFEDPNKKDGETKPADPKP